MSLCTAGLLDRGAMAMAEDVVVSEVAAAGHSQRRRRSPLTSSSLSSSSVAAAVGAGGGGDGACCVCLPASAAALSTPPECRCALPDVLLLGDVAWPAEVLTVWRTMRYSSLVGVFAALSRVWVTVDHKLLVWDYRTQRELCVYADVPELIIAVGTPVRPRSGVFAPHVTYVLPVATASMCLLLGLCMPEQHDKDGTAASASNNNDDKSVAAATAAMSSPLHIVNLGYSVATQQTLLTRIVGDVDAGRIFCAGADGGVYEVVYHGGSALLVPRMRLVCYSAACGFAQRALLSPLAALARTLRQTWAGPCAALRDLAVDSARKLLYALDERSSVAVWGMTRDGLRLLQTLPPPGPLPAVAAAHAVDEAVTLSRLFVIDADVDGCTLVAVASNGDQLRYRQLDLFTAYDGDGSGGGGSSNMVLHSCVRATLPAEHVVHVCLATDTAMLLAHSNNGSSNNVGGDDGNSGNSNTVLPDELTAVTMPTAIIEPPTRQQQQQQRRAQQQQQQYNSNAAAAAATTAACCVATSLHTPSSRIVRVDAMARLPDARPRPANELCAQLTHPPPRFVVVHRHGLTAYAQCRPVDTLYGILACSGSGSIGSSSAAGAAARATRAALLRAFAAAYSTADYACMLLQIAAGAHRVGCEDDTADGVVDAHALEAMSLSARRAQAAAAAAATGGTFSASSPLTLEQLSATVACGDAVVVRRAARELLRGLTQLTVERDTMTMSSGGNNVTTATAATTAGGAAARRQVTLAMSPLVQAVLLYTARACYAVWDEAIGAVSASRLAVVEAALTLLLRFVPRVVDEAYGDVHAGVDSSVIVAADTNSNNSRGGGAYGYRSNDYDSAASAAAAAWPTDVYTTSGVGGRAVQPYCSVTWQRGRVVLTLAAEAELTSEYVHSVHATALHAALTLASRAQQLATLLRHTRHVVLPAEEERLTFGLLVRDAAAAQRLGRCLTHLVLSAPLLGGDVGCNSNSSSNSSNVDGGATTTMGLSAVSAAQLRAFRALQQHCAYVFSSDDVNALVARDELLQLADSLLAHDATPSRVAEWVAQVAPQAAACSASGALQAVCQQLCARQHEEAAVRLLLHAARQLDATDACLPLYEADARAAAAAAAAADGGDMANEEACDVRARGAVRDGGGGGDVLAATYVRKMQLLALVVSIVERAWQTHRAAAERLLGDAHTSGTLWRIEPDDVVAHLHLLDWLAAPREDAAVTRHLRAALVAAASPHLHRYLAQHATTTLADVYARYLRCRKGDDSAAAEHSLALAQAPLPHVPSEERLAYRRRCLVEAVASARHAVATTTASSSSLSSQLAQMEQRLALLHAQQRLCDMVDGFVHSQLPQLERRWRMADGRVRSERAMAQEHLCQLRDTLCDASELLQLAGMYTRFGGAEVQLDVLAATHVSDAAAYAACVARVYTQLADDIDNNNNADDSNDDEHDAVVADTTRRLLQRYYAPNMAFPLVYVVHWLEAYHARRTPGGSRAVVRLLLRDCHVDVRVLFSTYEELLLRQQQQTHSAHDQDNISSHDDDDATLASVPHTRDDRARLSPAYLLHSLAVVLLHMAHAARKGTVAASMLSRAMTAMRVYVSQTAAHCARDYDGNDGGYGGGGDDAAAAAAAAQRRALEAAECVLRAVDEVARDVHRAGLVECGSI